MISLRSHYASLPIYMCANNQDDLPRCNVARTNKSKPEMARCGVASIFRWFRPLRVEFSSFPLLVRAVAMMAHVHTREPHARTYIRSVIRKEHTVKPPADFPHQRVPFVHSLATLNFSRLHVADNITIRVFNYFNIISI